MYCLAINVPSGTGACWYTSSGVYINNGITVPSSAYFTRTDVVSLLFYILINNKWVLLQLDCGTFIGHKIENPNPVGSGINVINIPVAELFFGNVIHPFKFYGNIYIGQSKFW